MLDFFHVLRFNIRVICLSIYQLHVQFSNLSHERCDNYLSFMPLPIIVNLYIHQRYLAFRSNQI